MFTETPERAEASTLAWIRHVERDKFPREVEMILSAMEAGRDAGQRDADTRAERPEREQFGDDRRVTERVPFRVRAELRLFSDRPGSPAWLLYIRDADPTGLGFVTPHRLPLGYGGYVELVAPNGRPLSVHCTLNRCREAVPGWYEGALSFNREQSDFRPP